MVMMVVQELERVEIQLEQSEQSVVGGSLPLVEVEEGTAAAASASIQTSSATASSSVMPLSRDEHMRLRLVALISSLQFAARYGGTPVLLCCVVFIQLSRDIIIIEYATCIIDRQTSSGWWRSMLLPVMRWQLSTSMIIFRRGGRGKTSFTMRPQRMLAPMATSTRTPRRAICLLDRTMQLTPR